MFLSSSVRSDGLWREKGGGRGGGGEGRGREVIMVTTVVWWSSLLAECSQDEHLGAESGDSVEAFLQERANGGTGTSRLKSY